MWMNEKPIQIATGPPAGQDFDAVNIFVKIASGVLVHCGVSGLAVGVIASKCKEDEPTAVYTKGIVQVMVGSGGITENTLVTSDASGYAITKSIANATTVHTNGVSLETASEGSLAIIQLA